MSDFETAIKIVLKNEDSSGKGKLTVDSGGLTRWGISQKAYPNEDIKHLSLERAKVLYKRDYFDKLRLGEITGQAIATKLMDASVNMGTKRPIIFIQEIVGVDADGVIGRKTIDAINSQNQFNLVVRFRNKQEDFYRNLAEKRPKKYGKYLAGWLNRVNSC